jgi:hypothetical protein
MLVFNRFTSSANGKRHTCSSLSQQHADLRTQLISASKQGGESADIARHLVRLVSVHFALEQEIVFPFFAFASGFPRDDVLLRMEEVPALIANFEAHRGDLRDQHEEIEGKLGELWKAACDCGNRDVILLALAFRSHERTENEVIEPVVSLVSSFLQNNPAGTPLRPH